jgi:hypothetical protein
VSGEEEEHGIARGEPLRCLVEPGEQRLPVEVFAGDDVDADLPQRAADGLRVVAAARGRLA